MPSNEANPNPTGVATLEHQLKRAPIYLLRVFFTTADGVLVNNIAKWSGSNWSCLGSGMNSSVHALAVSGRDLYAGGRLHDGGREGVRIYCPRLPAESACAFGASLRHPAGRDNGFLAV